jgi:amidase
MRPMRHLRPCFAASALLLAACGPDPLPLDRHIEDASVETIRNEIAQGRVSCRSIVAAALARIDALNHQGPQLRAVLETNPDALAIAGALDEARSAGQPMGPLHCVPLLVKDNFNTGDAMATTAASLTMGDFHPGSDAFVIAKLRAAGAVPIAKTNMDEWAQGTAGYSSRGGQVLNPYKLGRNTGGSSGGSAAGVAAGMGVLATGSDTGGSIRIPSASTGVVGVKPTLGLVGRTGVIPSSHALDVAGPMGRSVSDVAAMLDVMAGPDPGDPDSAASAGHIPASYLDSLRADGLAGARVGLLSSFHDLQLKGYNAESDAALDEAIATIARQGAVVRTGLVVPPVATDDEMLEMLGTLAAAKANDEIAGYLRTYRHPQLHSLADVAASAHLLGPSVVRIIGSLDALAAASYDAAKWASAQALRSRLIAAVQKQMDDAQVDALVFLTVTCPATPLPGTVDPGFQCKGAGAMPYEFGTFFGNEPILLASLTGMPEITVPAGLTRDGLPIAISFFGRPFSEPTLLKLAYAYELASQKRVKPSFNP